MGRGPVRGDLPIRGHPIMREVPGLTPPLFFLSYKLRGEEKGLVREELTARIVKGTTQMNVPAPALVLPRTRLTFIDHKGQVAARRYLTEGYCSRIYDPASNIMAALMTNRRLNNDPGPI